MTLKQLWSAWDSFWFTPQSPLPIAVFRILYGLLLLEVGCLIAPDLLVWFGTKGVFSAESAQKFLGAPCIDLLLLLPPDDSWVVTFGVVYLLSAVCLTLGLFTRVSSIIVYLTLTSFHHRDPLILNGGDTILRVVSFFLMFSQAGAALSLDRVIRNWRSPGGEKRPPQESSPWAQRLIQLELTALYAQALCSKLLGNAWVDGTAVYYVLQEQEFLRFPLPLNYANIWISKILTYQTMITEFLMCTLVWVKDLRYYIMALGLILHLGMEWSLNIPVFQQAILACYVLFIYPEDLQRIIDWIKAHLLFWKLPPSKLQTRN